MVQNRLGTFWVFWIYLLLWEEMNSLANFIQFCQTQATLQRLSYLNSLQIPFCIQGLKGTGNITEQTNEHKTVTAFSAGTY